MEKKFAHVTELKSTQELIDIYNHATDYQEQFVKEVYDELLARGVDGDKLFRERERYIQEQNKYVELGKKSQYPGNDFLSPVCVEILLHIGEAG